MAINEDHLKSLYSGDKVLLISGPNVVIGPKVRIEEGVCLQNCTVLSESVICTHTWISGSIIGRKVGVFINVNRGIWHPTRHLRVVYPLLKY